MWVRIPAPAGGPRLLPGRRTVGCTLLQVRVLGWVKCREHISLLIILCIIVYVTNKAHLSLICCCCIVNNNNDAIKKSPLVLKEKNVFMNKKTSNHSLVDLCIKIIYSKYCIILILLGLGFDTGHDSILIHKLAFLTSFVIYMLCRRSIQWRDASIIKHAPTTSKPNIWLL